MGHKIIDLLLLILAITIIYARYQALRVPLPNSDIPFVISGSITSVPISYGDRQYFKLGQVQIVARVPPEYQYGDYLTATGTLTPRMDMRYPKIVGALSGASERIVGEAGFAPTSNVLITIQKNLFNFRQTLVQQITTYLPSPEAELISGVLWGAKASLPKTFSDDLKRTGTIHLVVVSGYNISVICALLLTAFSVLGRKTATIATILGIMVFTLLTGAEAPSVRAAIMGGLVVLGQLWGRERTALRLLVISAGIMLIVNPLWAEDLGFQLSFLATLGILIFGQQKNTTKKNNDKRIANNDGNRPKLVTRYSLFVNQTQRAISTVFGAIWPELRATLAAQALTWPLIATTLGTVSLISPVANLLISWTVPLLMALGALLTILSPLSSLGSQVVSGVVLVPAALFVSVVTNLSKIPFASVDIGLGNELAIAYYLIIGAWLAVKRR